MLILIIRFILVTIYFLCACVVALFFCFIRPFDARVTTYCGQIFGRGLIPLMGAKIDYQNMDIIKNNKGPLILIANHQDNYDTFIVGYTSTDKTVSVGKKSIIYFPIFGLIYWLAGNIMIDRSNKKRALITMRQAGERMVKEKLKVLVMPEGTRSRGKGLQPFKKGAFHLAIQNELPIIPICVSSYSGKLNFKKLRAGHIIIRALPPISSKGYDKSNLDELAQKCHNIMDKEIKKLDQELLA